MFSGDSILYKRFIALVDSEFAMVLSTLDKFKGLPWSATVYFLYYDAAFYFLSSPKSHHINQSMESGVAAASIFFQSKFWSDIHGVQMLGRVKSIESFRLTRKVMKEYFIKFNFAKDLFKLNQQNCTGIKGFFEQFAVRPYEFRAFRMVYSDNHFGFGFKKEIRLKHVRNTDLGPNNC